MLEVRQQAQGPVQEPAPEVQARGQPAARVPGARPRGPARAPELDQEVRALAPRPARARVVHPQGVALVLELDQEARAGEQPGARAPEAAQEQGAERAPEVQVQEVQGLQARAEQVALQEVLVR